jgi:endonuclease/exonuclease/phosphatase (EEP) superfamily protein YafD
MRAVLIGLGLVLVAATVLPLVRRDEWWIRVFDFPRLQVTVALAATLPAYLLVRDDPGPAEHAFLAALGASLAYQAYRMYPYTPLARREVQPSRRATPRSTISLLFANVLMSNRRADLLRGLIREQDPDVVLAAETDAWWDARLAEELAPTHLHAVRQPQDNTYGMVLYSRLELREARVAFLVEADVPSIHATVLLRSGQPVALRGLHPRPPAPQGSDRSTERDAELLIVARETKAAGMPAIVLGDLNDVAWSRTNDLFHAISGLLDPRVGRGFYPTFHARWPLVRFPLDHVFHSPHFRLVAFQRLRWIGSDHFPVAITLSFEPEAAPSQEPEHPTPDEQAEAREKIDRAR